MSFTERKFVGGGRVHMRLFGTTDALLDVGDVEEVIMSREIEAKTIPNLRGGGGNAAKMERLVSVNFAIKFRDLQGARLAQMLRGTSTDVASGTSSSEAQTARLGGYIPLDYVDPTSIVVKDVTDTTTYTLGTDYTLGYNGIEIPATGSAISDTDVLHITYDYSAQKLIEALTQGAGQYHVHIDGINEWKTGEYYNLDVWKWQMNIADEINVLSQDFAELNSEGEALADSTQGVGESQYFRIKQTES